MKRLTAVIGGVLLVALIAIGGAFAQAGLIEIGEALAHEANHTSSVQVKGEDELGFAGMAKISLDSAVTAALNAVPGKALKAELENENGYLVYGVEIAKADRQIADVKVDAGNGKVLKIETDQKENEDREGEDSDNSREEEGDR